MYICTYIYLSICVRVSMYTGQIRIRLSPGTAPLHEGISPTDLNIAHGCSQHISLKMTVGLILQPSM